MWNWATSGYWCNVISKKHLALTRCQNMVLISFAPRFLKGLQLWLRESLLIWESQQYIWNGMHLLRMNWRTQNTNIDQNPISTRATANTPYPTLIVFSISHRYPPPKTLQSIVFQLYGIALIHQPKPTQNRHPWRDLHTEMHENAETNTQTLQCSKKELDLNLEFNAKKAVCTA